MITGATESGGGFPGVEPDPVFMTWVLVIAMAFAAAYAIIRWFDQP